MRNKSVVSKFTTKGLETSAELRLITAVRDSPSTNHCGSTNSSRAGPSSSPTSRTTTLLEATTSPDKTSVASNSGKRVPSTSALSIVPMAKETSFSFGGKVTSLGISRTPGSVVIKETTNSSGEDKSRVRVANAASKPADSSVAVRSRTRLRTGKSSSRSIRAAIEGKASNAVAVRLISITPSGISS